MEELNIQLLGRYEILINQTPLNLVSQKARGLLAYLAVEPPHIHTRAKLSDMLWPEEPAEKAAHNLRQALSALRKALDSSSSPDHFLEPTRDTIGLAAAAPLRVDAAVFADRAAAAIRPSQGGTRPDIRLLKKAAELYRGPFLEGFDLKDSEPYEEWVMLQRESLHRQAIRVYETLLAYHQRRGDFPSSLETAEKLLYLAPWDEQIRRLLMTLYAGSGQKHTALALYHSGVLYLRETLDLDPAEETRVLFEQLRNGKELPVGHKLHGGPELLLPPVETETNLLPASTPFIGRRKALDDLSTLIARDSVRLITICGPGGIGKTRLAHQTAAEQVGLFPDGVFFISLEAVDSSERLFPLIAQHLEIQPIKGKPLQEHLLNVLRDRELLLVMDNFEHLQLAAPLLSQILSRTRSLQILATSRLQLNIQQEWVYNLDSMSVPAANAEADIISSCESADLFLQSVRRLGIEVRQDEASLRTIAAICRLVEGFPLGIELAASTMRGYTLQEIHQQMQSSLGSVAASARDIPERHRSLQATFEYSWQLLDDTSRDALRRLSVFHGTFDATLAFRLTGVSRKTLDNLLLCSLLRREEDRFAFHPLVQQFARAKLNLVPREKETLQQEYAGAYAAFLSENSALLHSSERLHVLENLRREEGNLAAAWNLALTCGNRDLINQAMEGMFRYYLLQGRYQEGLAAFSTDGSLPDSGGWEYTRGWIALYNGVYALNQGNYALAQEFYTSAEQLFLALDAEFELAVCRTRQAGAAIPLGQYEQALALCNQALPAFHRSEDSWWLALAAFLAGDALCRLGQINQARQTLEQSEIHARRSGDPARISASLNTLADVMCYQGEFEEAELRFRECLQISRSLKDTNSAAVHLNNLGTIFHLQEKWDDAALSYQESLDICRQLGDRYGEAIALSNLGEIALVRGDVRAAENHFRKGLAISEELGNTWSTLACLANLADTALSSSMEGQDDLYRALSLALETSTINILPRLLILAARRDIRNGNDQRAALLIAQVLYTDEVDEAIRSEARSLISRHEITLPEVFPSDLATSARVILADLPVAAPDDKG